MIKTNLIQKITLSGLFLALTIIFTRFLSIQNIPVIPFVRISLGPALIIFSSLCLGPICGLVVGAGSDILGIVMVPNALGYSINPLFTLVYGLLGLLPWFIYKLVKKLKKPQIPLIIFASVMLSLCIFEIFFLGFNSDITLFGTTYHFEAWAKALIIVLSFVFSIAMTVAIYFTDRHFKKTKPDYDGEVNFVALTCLIAEIFVMLILNTIVKTFFFEMPFLVVFFSQAVVFFIDVTLNTIVASILLMLAKRYIKAKY